jgi:peptidyl-prolyl cis-trans isomerase B (cyclophilin B)
VARVARLSLTFLALALAGCGGGGAEATKTTAEKPCPTHGSDATFPLLDAKTPHTVDALTNYGRFAIRLDVEDSPCVTSSFAALVRRGYFDGTTFHRIVPHFVIQGGDPSGSGAGGPGYTVVEPPPASSLYTEGVVAMAKTAAEPRGAAGSQFFIVTATNAGLPPDYAILGVVTKGLKVVRRIGRFGNPTTEKPTKRVVVLKMNVV